jgi:hypothetical protein
MNTGRYDDGSDRRAIWRPARGSYHRWVRVFERSRIDASTRSGQKRIFAIVSRPIPVDNEGNTIRRVVIFDNHPESLRLMSYSEADTGTHDAACRPHRRTSMICGTIVLALVVAALLWASVW